MRHEVKLPENHIVWCKTVEEAEMVQPMLWPTHDKTAKENFESFDGDMAYCKTGMCRKSSYEQSRMVLSASEFIAMNTEPEAALAWSFKTDEELAEMIAKWESRLCKTEGAFEEALDFLSSLRKPAFELVTADNVKVTDPGLDVWFIERIGVVKTEAELAKNDVRDRLYFSTREAALNHRLQNTPAIKLSDMRLTHGLFYQIDKNVAESLVNERIK